MIYRSYPKVKKKPIKTPFSPNRCLRRRIKFHSDRLLLQGIVDDPVEFFAHFTPATVDLFNYFCWCSSRMRRIHPSQVTIAKYLDYCRETVSRSARVLAFAGIISIDPPGGDRNTNLYEISSFFRLPQVMELLAPIIQHVFELKSSYSPFKKYNKFAINRPSIGPLESNVTHKYITKVNADKNRINSAERIATLSDDQLTAHEIIEKYVI